MLNNYSPLSAAFCQTFTYPDVSAVGFGCGTTANSQAQTVLLSANEPKLELRLAQVSSSVDFLITSSTTSVIDVESNPACSWVEYALSFCESASPGFATMDVTDQAPCLCYSSTSWSPDFFDGAVATCVEYVSTAAPSLYTDLTAMEGFCSSVGNVYTQTGGASSSTNQTASNTGSPQATTTFPLTTSQGTDGGVPSTTATGPSTGGTPKGNGLQGEITKTDSSHNPNAHRLLSSSNRWNINRLWGTSSHLWYSVSSPCKQFRLTLE